MDEEAYPCIYLASLHLDQHNHHPNHSHLPASSFTSAHHHSLRTSSSSNRRRTRDHLRAQLQNKVRKLACGDSPRTPKPTPTTGDLAPQSPVETKMVDAIATGSTLADASMVDANSAGSVGQPLMLRRSASASLLSLSTSFNDMAVDQRPNLQSGSIHVDRNGNQEVVVHYKCACDNSCQINGNGGSFDFKCFC